MEVLRHMKNWIHSKENQDDIILSSKVQLSRNIKGKRFSLAMLKEEAREIPDEIFSKMDGNTDNFRIIKSWESSQNELRYYKDREITTSKFIDQRDKSAFLLNNNETLSILINEEDHIKIQGVTVGSELDEAYKKVNDLDDYINQFIDYEFSKKYGYLTSSIENLGTGLRLSALVHLPAIKLENKIDNLKNTLSAQKINCVEVYKEANLFRITNKITIGVTEKELIDKFNDAITYIKGQENINMQKLLTEKRMKVEDKILRSYGLLSYAKVIDSVESLKLLSDMRMGIQMDILDIDESLLNEAFVSSRDASIQRSLREILSKEELDYKRAQVIREILL